MDHYKHIQHRLETNFQKKLHLVNLIDDMAYNLRVKEEYYSNNYWNFHALYLAEKEKFGTLSSFNIDQKAMVDKQILEDVKNSLEGSEELVPGSMEEQMQLLVNSDLKLEDIKKTFSKEKIPSEPDQKYLKLVQCEYKEAKQYEKNSRDYNDFNFEAYLYTDIEEYMFYQREYPNAADGEMSSGIRRLTKKAGVKFINPNVIPETKKLLTKFIKEMLNNVCEEKFDLSRFNTIREREQMYKKFETFMEGNFSKGELERMEKQLKLSKRRDLLDYYLFGEFEKCEEENCEGIFIPSKDGNSLYICDKCKKTKISTEERKALEDEKIVNILNSFKKSLSDIEIKDNILGIPWDHEVDEKIPYNYEYRSHIEKSYDEEKTLENDKKQVHYKVTLDDIHKAFEKLWKTSKRNPIEIVEKEFDDPIFQENEEELKYEIKDEFDDEFIDDSKEEEFIQQVKQCKTKDDIISIIKNYTTDEIFQSCINKSLEKSIEEIGLQKCIDQPEVWINNSLNLRGVDLDQLFLMNEKLRKIENEFESVMTPDWDEWDEFENESFIFPKTEEELNKILSTENVKK